MQPLSCPFCDAETDVCEAYLVEEKELVEGRNKGFMVSCMNKYCLIRPDTDICDTEEEAIEAWNRRG